MRNKYPGWCCICGKYVPKGKGHFEPNRKKCYGTSFKWFVRCLDCIGKGAAYKQPDKYYKEKKAK